jgi:hypothetical protein
MLARRGAHRRGGKYLSAIALTADAGRAARQLRPRLAQPSAGVRQMIFAEWTRFEVLEKRSDRASPSLKLPGGHWKSPSLRDGPLNNLFRSVILTTNEIKLCSDLLASFIDELRQALQICRGAYGSQ